MVVDASPVDAIGADCAPRMLTWFRSHEELRAFDSLRAPIWVFDVEHHAMWWGNLSALKFWDVASLADLLARDFSTDSEIVRLRLRQIVEDPRATKSVQETWTLFPHGRPITVILDFKPILIENQRQAVLIEASYPIDLDRDQDALRILEAARSTPLLVSTFDLDGRLLAQNPAATECYRPLSANGEDAPESRDTLGKRLADPAAVERIRQAVASNETALLDAEVKTVAGRRYHRLTARRGRDPISGEPAIVVTEENISDRVELEQALARANRKLEDRVEERTRELFNLTRRVCEETDRRAETEAALQDQFALLQTLIDTIPAPIFYKDRDGLHLGCNRAFEDLVGAPRDEIVGKSAAELCAGSRLDDHLLADRGLLTDGNGIQIYETVIVDPSGEARQVVIHKGVTRHSDGQIAGLAGVIVDVTELKQAETRLREVQRLESIGRLTGGIAHDFNNLLTVILGNLELLADQLEGDGEAEAMTGAALRAVDRGRNLTGQLLAYARKQPLTPKVYDINGLLGEIAGLLERTLGETIEVVTRLEPKLPEALVDSSQLQNAILNICLNARDALAPEGGRLEIRTGLAHIGAPTGARVPNDLAPGSELGPGNYVMVTIEDSGGGMTEDVLSQAIEPFFSTKEVGQGSGLGLSMAYGFARQTGGTLAIESHEGEGTKVTLYLPEAAGRTGLEEEPAVWPVARPVPRSGEGVVGARILVVEDDPDVLGYVTACLTALGHQVSSAVDGNDALEMLKADRNFELLFTDVVLPGGLSGRELAERAVEMLPALKVLYSSGYSKDKIVENCCVEAGLAFLAKPYRRRDLVEALERVLD